MAATQLIVGLGNPGADYAQTRHNVGAWFVQALCDAEHVQANQQNKLHARTCQIRIEGKAVRLAMPTTFMNESGLALRRLTDYFGVAPEQTLVVHDELDFEPGIARLKFGGGHGGHNGLRDIVPHLKTADFARLRIGIGHPGNKNRVANYVLTAPKAAERDRIDTCITLALRVVPELVTGQWQAAVQKLHSTINTN